MDLRTYLMIKQAAGMGMIQQAPNMPGAVQSMYNMFKR